MSKECSAPFSNACRRRMRGRLPIELPPLASSVQGYYTVPDAASVMSLHLVMETMPHTIGRFVRACAFIRHASRIPHGNSIPRGTVSHGQLRRDVHLPHYAAGHDTRTGRRRPTSCICSACCDTLPARWTAGGPRCTFVATCFLRVARVEATGWYLVSPSAHGHRLPQLRRQCCAGSCAS